MLNTRYILLDKRTGNDDVCGIIAVVDGIAKDFAICPGAKKTIAAALVEKLNRLDVDCIHFQNIVEDNIV